MTDSELEAIVDRRVQRRLVTDRRYLHAADAEQQSIAEQLIETEVELELLRSRLDRGRSFAYAARVGELETLRAELVEQLYAGEVLL